MADREPLIENDEDAAEARASAATIAESGHTAGPETEAERHARIAWEAECITEADAELEAGLYVEAADIRAWIESIGTDHELPAPPTRDR